MDDFEVNFQEDKEQEQGTTQTQFAKPIYKKWFKAGGQGGVISIEPWLSAQKFVVDIGKLDGSNNLVSSTKCYVDAINLIVYLKAVTTGVAPSLYPKRKDCSSPEAFIAYGGSPKANPVTARVFKINYWGAKADNEGSPSGFAWKCGQFEGTVTDTGAVTPKYDKLISADMIKVSRMEMHEIAERTHVALQGYAAKFNDWYG